MIGNRPQDVTRKVEEEKEDLNFPYVFMAWYLIN
jgi:hypothetical protein